MAIEWRALAPYVAPQVPGCPMPAILGALREAAREFCRDTWVWRQKDTVRAREGVTRYPLRLPSDSAFVALASVTRDGRPLAHEFEPPETVVLVSAPRGDFEVALALMPSLAASAMPAYLAEQWGEAIGHGARGRLLAEPGKPWTNGPAAQDSRNLFQRAKGEAKARIATAYGSAPQTVQLRPLI